MTRLSREHWMELGPLFDRALDLPPGERTVWLREQRRTNPTLVTELEELLAREEQVEQEGFLEAPPPAPDGLSLAGRTLGPWLLVAPAGARREENGLAGSAVRRTV